ncbi:MAG: Rpn family recombination-promoting nuclease/putative transposase [Candidatus Tectomicrobia bacterium]|nr:Rpn family recombination-promoting nuclease/putative transposase [Candidatus Tectomicrobia bacterium]
MADEIHHPHDNMVHSVLRDPTEATSFLQAHLPQGVSQGLNWATLRLHDRSFVDEDLLQSASDFLYDVEYASGDETIWIYCLVEHQSTPDRWMRFRLLKYCCRIWDVNLEERPTPSELRPIVPLVFYQGERTWSYSREFADLFAESVREWPGVPHFSHGLIDQSGMRPEEVQGELKARLMQLLLMAAYHPTVDWMEQVAELFGSLSSLPPSGGANYIRIFVRYLLATQEPEAVESFREVLRDYAPAVRDDLMTTYAQELLAEGRAEGEQLGKIKNQVEVIEGLLREGLDWAAIERVTRVNETQFQTLKQQVDNMNE